MKKTLFIIESPLQLICAYEAIHKFQLNKIEIILRLADNGRNNDQILKLKHVLFSHYKVREVYIKPQNRNILGILHALYLMLYVSFKVYLGYHIFIGYFDSKFAKLLTLFVSDRKKIYLDDGVASLSYPESVLESNSSFFSIFNFERDNFMRNEFNYLSNYLQGLNKEKRKEIVVFIGSPIRQLEEIEVNNYFNAVLKIKEKYKALDFVYFPHRRELKEDLDKISSYGIQVVENNYPIEMFYYEFSNYHPYIVASLVSTAMFTMSLIYNSKVVMCNGVIKENVPDLENVFNAIKKIENIDILECYE